MPRQNTTRMKKHDTERGKRRGDGTKPKNNNNNIQTQQPPCLKNCRLDLFHFVLKKHRVLKMLASRSRFAVQKVTRGGMGVAKYQPKIVERKATKAAVVLGRIVSCRILPHRVAPSSSCHNVGSDHYQFNIEMDAFFVSETGVPSMLVAFSKKISDEFVQELPQIFL
mmetsp:Transcript_21193/g.44558  ORF Transcript_21193/g.44558 Transcript_21193/m.44558 type:complete len:167 (-) Transcript_21193:321-821(-)